MGEWGSRGHLTGRGREQGHQPRLECESECGGGKGRGQSHEDKVPDDQPTEEGQVGRRTPQRYHHRHPPLFNYQGRGKESGLFCSLLSRRHQEPSICGMNERTSIRLSRQCVSALQNLSLRSHNSSRVGNITPVLQVERTEAWSSQVTCSRPPWQEVEDLGFKRYVLLDSRLPGELSVLVRSWPTCLTCWASPNSESSSKPSFLTHTCPPHTGVTPSLEVTSSRALITLRSTPFLSPPQTVSPLRGKNRI